MSKFISRLSYKDLLRHISFICLFLLLPLIVAELLGNRAVELDKGLLRKTIERKLEKDKAELASRINLNNYLSYVGNWSLKQIQTNPSPENINKIIQRVSLVTEAEFDLYAFNDNGSLITPNNIKLKSRFLLKKLWKLLGQKVEKGIKQAKRIKKPLATLFGSNFRIADFFENRGNIFSIKHKLKDGLVYWNSSLENQKSGIVIVFWQIPKSSIRIFRVVNSFFSAKENAFIVSPDNELKVFNNSISKEKLRIVENKFLLSDSPFKLLFKRLWTSVQVDGFKLFISKKVSFEYFRNLKASIRIFLIMLFGFLTCIYWFLVRKNTMSISLRWKLSALFMVAVLSPIMGFTFLGKVYLNDKRDNEINLTNNASRNLILSLDRSFKDSAHNFYRNFKDIRDSFIDSENYVQSKKSIKQKLDNFELLRLCIRDINGKPRLIVQNELLFEGMHEIFSALSKLCIDKQFGTSLAKTMDPLVEMVLKAPEAALYWLADFPDQVHLFKFGAKPFYLYWDTYVDRYKNKKYFFLAQSSEILLSKLISKKMKEIYRSKANAPFIMLAQNTKTRKWLPALPQNLNEFERFAQRVSVGDKPVDDLISIGGEIYLITGAKAKHVDHFCLFTLYPLDLIDKQILVLRKGMIGGVVIFIIAALSLSFLLSANFLVPIQNLSDGVLAIKRQDAEFRIPVEQYDEFGDLAVAFNRMIEDLKEMEVAREVQKSLIPQKIPAFAGIEISLENRMASQVGGDYCDIQKMEDGRIFVLIGDVTGHGVSSALVMAMAKAIVYKALKDGKELLEIMSDLNSVIHTYFKIPPTRKMITVFAAVIDPLTGEFEFANAGHNFPIQIRKDGTKLELAAIHLPIGARKSMKGLALNQGKLEEGEIILFYTDGIIEAKNAASEMFTYERLGNILEKSFHLSVENLKDHLMNEYEKHVGDELPDDDVTLIAIKKIPIATA